MINVYIIGCGGIGGDLIEKFMEDLASISLDTFNKLCGHDGADRWLRSNGHKSIPSIVDRITLVDGDVFNPRNALRQGMGAGSKLALRLDYMSNTIPRRIFLPTVDIVGYQEYLTPVNMAEIIPHNPMPNDLAEQYFNWTAVGDLHGYEDSEYDPDSGIDRDAEQDACIAAFKQRFKASVVFICVDNMKTRYEISKYMETFDNCLVINGGNEKTTGHVTVYERANGIALDPNIYEVYPNVRPDIDKRPDEIACTQISPEHDQVSVTNRTIAALMQATFSKWARNGLTPRKDPKRKRQAERKNEIIVDLENFSMLAVNHPLAKNQTKENNNGND